MYMGVQLLRKYTLDFKGTEFVINLMKRDILELGIDPSNVSRATRLTQAPSEFPVLLQGSPSFPSHTLQ